MLENLIFTASQVYLLAWYRHKNRIRAGIGEDGISWSPKNPCWLFLFFYATHCSAYWEKQWVKFGTSMRGNFSLSDNLFYEWILWWKKLTVLHGLANIANFIPSFQVQSVRAHMKTKQTNNWNAFYPKKFSMKGDVLITNIFNRTPMNYLLANLAISDIMFASFQAPNHILKRAFTHPKGTVGSTLCKVLTNGNVAWIGAAASAVTLVAIAVERYFAVACPIGTQRKLTKQKVKVS